MSSMTTLLGRQAQRVLCRLLNRVPTAQLEILLADTAARRARSLTPDDGLRFLFGLDAAPYPV